jgi:hypothetical protein
LVTQVRGNEGVSWLAGKGAGSPVDPFFPFFPPFPLAADHVSHLENVSEDEINRLLGMVVDVENLFMSVHKEEDTDTKQVYFYLFKVSFDRRRVCE